MASTGAHPRYTDAVGSLWRCGDGGGAYPLFSGIGAGLFPGRWNTAASPMIYASETFSTALLEKLVHLNGVLPARMHAVEILFPDGVSIEHVDIHALPAWLTNEAGDEGVRRGVVSRGSIAVAARPLRCRRDDRS